jgi:hypothetical protein
MKKTGPSVPQLISDIALWTLRYYHVSQLTVLLQWEILYFGAKAI